MVRAEEKGTRAREASRGTDGRGMQGIGQHRRGKAVGASGGFQKGRNDGGGDVVQRPQGDKEGGVLRESRRDDGESVVEKRSQDGAKWDYLIKDEGPRSWDRGGRSAYPLDGAVVGKTGGEARVRQPFPEKRRSGGEERRPRRCESGDQSEAGVPRAVSQSEWSGSVPS